MRDFGSSIRHRSTVLFMTCMLLGKGAAQDFTKALIWSTYSSFGEPELIVFFGNPATYVPDIANGRNGSYVPYYYKYRDAVFEIGAVDMLYSTSYVYYSLDMKLFLSTQLIPRTGAVSDYANVPALSKVVTGISVDWVSSLIYWSDASYQRICMFDLATLGFWRTVVDTNLTLPQDVVVYPQQSFLFWSDLGGKSVIERFDLATDDRRILLSSPTLQRPTTLVVDFANQRLFWLDASAATIGSMNLDGSSVSLWTSSVFSSISSFALFQNYIFLGRNDVSCIYIYDHNHQYTANITLYGTGIIDMTVYSEERNPSVSSPCTIGNGGCDHMCITVNSTLRRCMCGMGFFLASNGVDCVTKPMQNDKFLLVSDQRQCNIFQVNVDTGEVRALTINKGVFPYTTAFAFDPFRNYLYYFDKRTLVIMRTSLDATVSTSLPNVTKPLGSDITSLAFDSENQILFFVDYVVQTISAMYLSNLSTITIYSQAGSRPRTIVLDTNNRLLYWSDCGYNTIERGSKTDPNTNRMTIIPGLSVCAMTFAIDFQNQMIFWADASGSIETAMLDGTARSVVFQDSNAAFTGLALDAQFIYVAASNKLQIQKIDRNTKQISNLTKILFTQPFALLYISKDTASTASSVSTPAASSGLPSLKTASPESTSSTASSGSSTVTPAVTIIILASVISGAAALIAEAVTVGSVVAKRRRVASAGNSPSVVVDSSRPYETSNADRRDDSNPQVFTSESFYADGILRQA